MFTGGGGGGVSAAVVAVVAAAFTGLLLLLLLFCVVFVVLLYRVSREYHRRESGNGMQIAVMFVCGQLSRDFALSHQSSRQKKRGDIAIHLKAESF